MSLFSVNKKLVSLPLTVLKKTRLGARKWKGPLLGLTLQRFLRKAKYFTKTKCFKFICKFDTNPKHLKDAFKLNLHVSVGSA